MLLDCQQQDAFEFLKEEVAAEAGLGELARCTTSCFQPLWIAQKDGEEMSRGDRIVNREHDPCP